MDDKEGARFTDAATIHFHIHFSCPAKRARADDIRARVAGKRVLMRWMVEEAAGGRLHLSFTRVFSFFFHALLCIIHSF